MLVRLNVSGEGRKLGLSIGVGVNIRKVYLGSSSALHERPLWLDQLSQINFSGVPGANLKWFVTAPRTSTFIQAC